MLQDFVNFVAEEIEVDTWERLAVSIVSAGRTRRGWSGSGCGGGAIRAFIAGLRRAVDGRDVRFCKRTAILSFVVLHQRGFL